MMYINYFIFAEIHLFSNDIFRFAVLILTIPIIAYINQRLTTLSTTDEICDCMGLVLYRLT